jgi:hypothetical protein
MIDNAIAQHLGRRPINVNPASPECFKLASMWIQRCLDSHTTCFSASNSGNSLPSRVIDVGPTPDSIPYLLLTNGEKGMWITLSHSWGLVQPLKTTLQNIGAHQKALPEHTLPSLFKDAIRVTRELKQRYLWIDSLCIIQDSVSDWLTESSQMGNIYKNSLVTIASYTTSNSSESMFDTTLTNRRADHSVKVACYSSRHDLRGHIVIERRKVDDIYFPGLLSRRAWAFQEDILSPRTLRWELYELAWQCRTESQRESEPSTKRNANNNDSRKAWTSNNTTCSSAAEPKHRQPKKSRHEMHPSVQVLWYINLQDFVLKNITFVTDRLPAISGVAKEVARHTGSEYFAGLWRQDLYRGLLWIAPGNTETNKTYVAPSWSV